jgi:hypothetical protein
MLLLLSAVTNAKTVLISAVAVRGNTIHGVLETLQKKEN